jgi:RimJ/RimL family protein N-acetyltransferase
MARSRGLSREEVRKTMELETSRLLLRPFEAGDLPHIQRYAVRPAFYRYLAIPVQTPETVAAFVAQQIEAQQREDGGNYIFVLEPKELKVAVGTVRLGVQSPVNGDADLGFSLDSDYQGRGYMTEAVRQIIRLGFDRLELRRIWATADVRNERSWRLMERVGMTREGRMREDKLVRGEWRDSYLYAILATDPPG